MPDMINGSPVTEVPAADSHAAQAHFECLLGFETDCWDVHAAMASERPGFVLLDVRSTVAFASGHVAGSINLPKERLNERTLEPYAADTLFVVYCAGPHCNGADKAAITLASLGRPVKKMIGGIEGWRVEGFELTKE